MLVFFKSQYLFYLIKFKKYIFHNGLRHFWRITMWDVETVECRMYRSAALVLFQRQSKNHLARWHRSSGFFQPPHCFICCQFLQLRFIWKASAAFICVWHPKRNLLLSTAVLFKACPGVNRWVGVRGIYNAVNDWSFLSIGPYPKAGRFRRALSRRLRFELFLFFMSVLHCPCLSCSMES